MLFSTTFFDKIFTFSPLEIQKRSFFFCRVWWKSGSYLAVCRYKRETDCKSFVKSWRHDGVFQKDTLNWMFRLRVPQTRWFIARRLPSQAWPPWYLPDGSFCTNSFWDHHRHGKSTLFCLTHTRWFSSFKATIMTITVLYRTKWFIQTIVWDDHHHHDHHDRSGHYDHNLDYGNIFFARM